MDLKKLCGQTKKIVLEVGDFIIAESDKFTKRHIEQKSPRSYVTYVDRTAEEKLVKGLQKILPEAGFITEEKTISKKGKKYNWVIDPLDGTTNFIHHIPCYAISVGLIENDKPILGVIYELNLKECFYAWENGGAFLNEKKISISKNKKLSESLIATGFPYDTSGKLNRHLKIISHFLKNTRGVRRLGAATVDLAYVACGRFDGFYEYNLNSWDVAAGIIIVKEADGKISDFRGGNDFLFGKQIIAACPGIFEAMKKVVRNF